MTTLRTIIIGVGAGIFATHRTAMPADRFEIVGVTDVNRSIGEERSAELGAPFYADLKSMLAEARAEVAVIVTPHPFHAPLAIEAMRAGCHVLVEKPIAVEVSEADAMIEAASQTGRLLTISLQLRFRPEVQAAYEIIKAGKLGELQHVHLTALWPRTARYFALARWRGTWRGEGGGVLMNQSPHNLDLLCHLAGMPHRVMAWTRTRIHHIETEDTVSAMLEWPNGALGELHVSTAETGTPERLELIGTNGSLSLSNGGVQWQQFSQDIRQFIAESQELYSGPALQPLEVTLPDSKGNHAAVYNNLYNAIVHGEALVTDGRGARMSLELANGILYASNSEKPVEFPLDRERYGAFLEKMRKRKPISR